MGVEIEIDRTDSCVWIGRDLFCELWRTRELPLYRRMQPPLVPTTYKGGTAVLDSRGDFSSRQATFEPTPTRPCPDFEENAPFLSVFPHARIERSGLIPRAWWNRWTLTKLLAFGLGFLFLRSPF